MIVFTKTMTFAQATTAKALLVDEGFEIREEIFAVQEFDDRAQAELRQIWQFGILIAPEQLVKPTVARIDELVDAVIADSAVEEAWSSQVEDAAPSHDISVLVPGNVTADQLDRFTGFLPRKIEFIRASRVVNCRSSDLPAVIEACAEAAIDHFEVVLAE